MIKFNGPDPYFLNKNKTRNFLNKAKSILSNRVEFAFFSNGPDTYETAFVIIVHKTLHTILVRKSLQLILLYFQSFFSVN